jgi:hypothetical protein
VESPEYSLRIVLAVGAALAILGLFVGWRLAVGLLQRQKYQGHCAKLDQVMQDKKAYEDNG